MQKLLELQKLWLKFKKEWKANYWKYITLDDLLDKLLPECNRLDILVYHNMVDWKVITTVWDWKTTLTSEFPISNMSSEQKIWASISYAKRYNLWQLFNIVTDDDTDDWNKVTDKKIVKKDFTQEMYEKFEKEHNKYVSNYPTSESMLKMLDTQYIISDEFKKKITEFYKSRAYKNANK